MLDLGSGSGTDAFCAGTIVGAAGEADLVALANRFDRLDSDGAIAIPATYIEAIAVRR